LSVLRQVDRLQWLNVPVTKNGAYSPHNDLQKEVYTLNAIRAKRKANALKRSTRIGQEREKAAMNESGDDN